MGSHRFVLLSFIALTLAACSKGGSSNSSSVSATANVLTYQIATTDVATGTVQVDDIAYVDFDKSRLIVADFNVCFRVIALDAADIAGLQEAILYANSGQAQAQAACASSAENYSVTSAKLSSTLAVCGTDLKDKLDTIMARGGTRLCKPLADVL